MYHTPVQRAGRGRPCVHGEPFRLADEPQQGPRSRLTENRSRLRLRVHNPRTIDEFPCDVSRRSPSSVGTSGPAARPWVPVAARPNAGML